MKLQADPSLLITTKSSPPNTAVPLRLALIEAAAAEASKVGIGSLTGRAIARRANVSASAIAYHFGDISGLLHALYGHLEDGRMKWETGMVAEMRALSSDILTPSGVVFSAISNISSGQFRQLLLIQEYRDLMRCGRIDLGDLGEKSWYGERDFIAAMLSTLPCSGDAIDLWTYFMAGAMAPACADPSEPSRSAWLSSVCQRAEERLAGLVPALRPTAPITAVYAPEPNWPTGKHRIISAAIDLIVEQGVAQVTHRRVAEASGLSLAATTYFFRTKSDLITEALRTLGRQCVASSTNVSATERPLASSQGTKLSDSYWRQIFAINAIYVVAARDDALYETAKALRATRGLASSAWISSQPGFTAIDRLDGLVWTFVQNGIFQRSYTLQAKHRSAFIQNTSRCFLDLLFRR